MTEQTLRRLMENSGMEPDEIDDALSAWAENDRQERSDRAAEERFDVRQREAA